MRSGCRYWTTPTMDSFLGEFGMKIAITHGCAFGLVGKHGNNAGIPIKKPWKIASNHPIFLGTFPRKCQCLESIAHAECAGNETTETENYPPAMAEDVHWLLEYLTTNNLMRKRFSENSTSIACHRQHATPCRSVIMSCMKSVSNIEPDEPLAQAKSLETQKLIEDWSALFLPNQENMQRQRESRHIGAPACRP